MLNSVNLNTMKADITVKSLVYVAPDVETPAEEETPAEKPAEVPAEKPVITTEKPKISKIFLIAGAGAIIVILAIIAILFVQLKRK